MGLILSLWGTRGEGSRAGATTILQAKRLVCLTPSGTILNLARAVLWALLSLVITIWLKLQRVILALSIFRTARRTTPKVLHDRPTDMIFIWGDGMMKIICWIKGLSLNYRVGRVFNINWLKYWYPILFYSLLDGDSRLRQKYSIDYDFFATFYHYFHYSNRVED